MGTLVAMAVRIKRIVLLLSLALVATAAKPLPVHQKNATINQAERVARADTKEEKDRLAIEGKPLVKAEYKEAAASANVMKKKDDDACGMAYCDDLVHYKPELMSESMFLDQCIAAHREWEHSTDYSLECPHTPEQDASGTPKMPANARRQQQLLKLLEHTRKLIQDRRLEKAKEQANLYARDSLAHSRAKAAAEKDVAAGQKQRRMARALEKSMDVRAYQRAKRNSLRTRTRCKDGNVVGNVYEGDASGKRVPDCPDTNIPSADVTPEQGYLRTQVP